MTKEITPNTVIKAGNHLVSIGHVTHMVAIMSPNTHEFVKQKRITTNSKLRKVARKFNNNLNCGEDFCFEFMSEEKTIELIKILKS